MKSRPILFSTEMVQAVLEGRKTMTRRILKARIALDKEFRFEKVLENRDKSIGTHAFFSNDKIIATVKCPYGNVGDELWVKETLFDCSKYKNYPLFKEAVGNYIYKADEKSIGEHKWKPSIFMPRSASRILLQITDIRVERLNDISEDDALGEGIKYDTFNGNPWYFDYVTHEYSTCFPCISFRSLWVSINKVESWYANPYVWVIGFKKKEVSNA